MRDTNTNRLYEGIHKTIGWGKGVRIKFPQKKNLQFVHYLCSLFKYKINDSFKNLGNKRNKPKSGPVSIWGSFVKRIRDLINDFD